MRARALRANATPAERLLWRQLSARKVIGARFNRQVPIGPFTGDFVCRAVKLIVEVDGGQHARQAAQDARRTEYLEARGYRVLRFWNNDVMTNVEGVVAEIERTLRNLPSPNPSRKREGRSVEDGAPLLPSRLREGPGEGGSEPDSSDQP